MSTQTIKILLIEDDPEDADLLQEILSEKDAHLFEVEWVHRLRVGLERLAQGGIDIVLLDLSLPDSQGLETFSQAYAKVPRVPIVVLSGLDDETMAFKAVQLGAQDYLVKGEVGNRLLVRALRYAIERKQAQESFRLLEAAAKANLEAERALLAKRVQERTAKLSVANAQLARAARLKDEFLANMSHELRTPLNSILGLGETLQEEIPGKINSEQQEYLQGIMDSGRHLLALINDILDIAKIEAGKVKLDLDIVMVEDLCRSSLNFIKQIATKKRLRICSYFDHTIGTMLADERRVKQILVNLLSNAVKFTPQRGTIGLEVMKDEPRQVVEFTVWDTGIGIATEDLQHLFQPFVQVDSTLSREYNGSGLGLALVRHLTEMHSGSISVESEVGKGSRFTVTLPMQKWEAKEIDADIGQCTPTHRGTHIRADCGTHTHSAPPHIGRTHHGSQQNAAQVPMTSSDAPINILLAEDNEANIYTISTYLRSKGFNVIVARNGEEALERAKEDHPDLILMDIQMPKMDGLQAIQHIRADNTLSAVPIIALTAFAMPGDRERCLQAGANEYLSKPIRLKTLVQTIEQLAEQ